MPEPTPEEQREADRKLVASSAFEAGLDSAEVDELLAEMGLS